MTSLPHDLAARILDGSPDAVLICDRVGTVRSWNMAAERVFGFRATEAVGAAMDLIIPERLRARHWAAWDTAMKNGATRYGEGQLLAVPALHKDGRQIAIEFSIQLLKGVDDAVEWVVAFIRDVTERYRRVVKTVVSNSSFDRGSLSPTDIKPFDVFANGGKTGDWLLRLDSNQQPSG